MRVTTFFKALGIDGVVGIVFGGGALVMVTAMFFSLFAWYGLIALAVSLFLCWLIWTTNLGPVLLKAGLAENGESAEAKILSIKSMNVAVRMNTVLPRALMKITAEIRPKNGMPVYEATFKSLIDAYNLAFYQVGTVVPVKFDPNHPRRVSLDTSGGSGGMRSQSVASQVQDALRAAGLSVDGSSGSSSGRYKPGYSRSDTAVDAMLNEMYSEQPRLFAMGEEAKANILNAEVTDIKLSADGKTEDGIVVKLDVEVYPVHGTPFTAKTMAGVKRMNLPKFVKGKEITVKFDPNDHSKVAVFHAG